MLTRSVVEAIERTRKRLPFRLRGFDTDNDCAFINQTVLDYCRRTELEFTRSRAYRKNDQAWVEQKNGAIVRKLAGYDRLSGVGGAEKLARLYEFSRLYVNCFQPSFKLKSKTRTGARVSKRHHAPVTPYDRVMAAPSVPETRKEHLGMLFHQLDPIELIKGIRCVQAKLNAMATLQPAPSEPQSNEAFVRELRIAWQEGEVRPTHRRRKAAVRHWRTRADPFEQVWTLILEQLHLTPDITAKHLFYQLQAEHPGRFPKCQLRTLQRRVKQWRSEMARSLIMSASEIKLAAPELLLTSERA